MQHTEEEKLLLLGWVSWISGSSKAAHNIFIAQKTPTRKWKLLAGFVLPMMILDHHHWRSRRLRCRQMTAGGGYPFYPSPPGLWNPAPFLTIKAGAEATRETLSADFSVCLSQIVPDVVGVDGSFFPCGVVGRCELRGISSLLLILGDQGTVVTKFSGRSCCCCYCSLGQISGRAERLSSDAPRGSGFLELLPGNFTSIVFQIRLF